MLFNLFASLILPLGYGAAVISINDDVNHVEVVNQVQPKLVTYNDSAHEITLSVGETSYSFVNFYNYVMHNFGLQSVNIKYGGVTFAFDSQYNDFVNWVHDSSYVSFMVDYSAYGNEELPLYNYFFFDSSNDILLSGDLTIGTISDYYQGLKNAIELDIQANENESMASVLGDFVSILVGGISTLATGIASGVVSMASALFLNVDASGNVTGLSIFGGIIAIFAGLALSVGITTKVYTWVTSLGN